MIAKLLIKNKKLSNLKKYEAKNEEITNIKSKENRIKTFTVLFKARI